MIPGVDENIKCIKKGAERSPFYCSNDSRWTEHE